MAVLVERLAGPGGSVTIAPSEWRTAAASLRLTHERTSDGSVIIRVAREREG